MADYFGVSIDYLVGNRQISSTVTESPRKIAELLIHLFEGGLIKADTISADEWIMSPMFDIENQESYMNGRYQTSEHPCIYFMNYYDPMIGPFSELTEVEKKYSPLGDGFITPMYDINSFIPKFLEIFKLHSSLQISDDIYAKIINEFLNDLDN